MPWPLNRIVESADEVGDLMMIVNMIRAAAFPRFTLAAWREFAGHIKAGTASGS
jgi:hypothetical protein